MQPKISKIETIDVKRRKKIHQKQLKKCKCRRKRGLKNKRSSIQGQMPFNSKLRTCNNIIICKYPSNTFLASNKSCPIFAIPQKKKKKFNTLPYAMVRVFYNFVACLKVLCCRRMLQKKKKV